MWLMAPGTWASLHWGKAGLAGEGGQLYTEAVNRNRQVLWFGPGLDHCSTVSIVGARLQSPVLLGPLSWHHTAKCVCLLYPFN